MVRVHRRASALNASAAIIAIARGRSPIAVAPGSHLDLHRAPDLVDERSVLAPAVLAVPGVIRPHEELLVCSFQNARESAGSLDSRLGMHGGQLDVALFGTHELVDDGLFQRRDGRQAEFHLCYVRRHGFGCFGAPVGESQGSCAR